MKSFIKRKRIFDTYSQNLKDVLACYNLKLATRGKTGYEIVDSSSYICPLCYNLFFEEDLIVNRDGTSSLTLEHNPPSNVKGSAQIITCKSCNNTYGSKLDNSILDYLLNDSFRHGKPGAVLPVKYDFGSIGIKGELVINEKDSMNLVIDQKSNPYGFSKILSSIKHQSIHEFKLRFKEPSIRSFSKMCLKVAHLTAFRYFGYSYLFNNVGRYTYKFLIDEIVHPCEHYGLFGFEFPDESIGVNFLNNPIDLKGIFIVQRFKVVDSTFNVGILLPGFNQDCCSNLNKLDNYRQKNVKLEMTKYIIKDCPVSPEMFAATFEI